MNRRQFLKGTLFAVGWASLGKLSIFVPKLPDIVGYKGFSYFESGYVYCPYIPLISVNINK